MDLGEDDMARLCEGRVCIVTGAGRGIGREHALMLAEHGAKIVVNDLGGSMDGEGTSGGPAHDVVAEIVAAGGEAVANADDISDLGRRRQADRAGRRRLRSSRRVGEQRRHPARPHAGEHDRGRMGRGHQGAPEGHGRALAPRRPRTGVSSRRRARTSTRGSSTRRRRRASTATPDRRTTARRRPASPRSR